MAVTLSPNMQLPIPGVGTEPGPDYAIDVNSSLTILDQHDHTNGSGVKITPLAIDINTALTFNGFAATNVAYVTLEPQGATPPTTTIYAKGVDLYFVDANGNDIQITDDGGIAGTPGSIANLTPPASVSYQSISKTFVFQSDTSIAANIDAASYLFRNITPNSTFALTLQPPAALSNNYSLTLPTIPASNSFMTLSSTGVMSAITQNQGLVTGNYQDLSVTTAKIADGAVTSTKLAASSIVKLTSVQYAVSGSFIVPSNINTIIVTGCGAGGGGGCGAINGPAAPTSGGGGGSGGSLGEAVMIVTPGETLTVTIGTGGSGGATSGLPGTAGTQTTITGALQTLRFAGGLGGAGGVLTGTAAGGGLVVRGGSANSVGGSSTAGTFGTPSAGDNSIYALGGAAGANGGSGTGGGGGGAAVGPGGAGAAGNLSAGGNGTFGSGGGGSGGSTSAGQGPGGAGGNGYAIITYAALP